MYPKFLFKIDQKMMQLDIQVHIMFCEPIIIPLELACHVPFIIDLIELD